MTKDEFYEDITDFDELIEFCHSNGCSHIVEDLRHRDDFDEWVWDCLDELRSRWFWHDLRNALEDLEAPGTDYFIPGGDLEYREVGTRDLDLYMDEVIDWGDYNDFWDDEEEEDDEDWIEGCEDILEEDDEPPFEISINLPQFIGVA